MTKTYRMSVKQMSELAWICDNQGYAYILTVDDATHLGGPMGTERTYWIETKCFPTIQEAGDYLRGKYKNANIPKKLTMGSKDCLSIIINLDKITSKDLI